MGCGIGLRPPHHGREASQAVPARFGWIPHGFNGFRAAGSPGKSGGKHKNDLQEARSARLASSQVSSPHASRTCTCLAHTHSLRPRRMSTHAQHVGFSRVVDAFCIATMRRAACSMHSICPARDPYASRAHSRNHKTYLLLRRAFDTGIRARCQGLGAALLSPGPAVPLRVAWSSWRVREWLGSAGWGSLGTSRAGGVAVAAAMLRDTLR